MRVSDRTRPASRSRVVAPGRAPLALGGDLLADLVLEVTEFFLLVAYLHDEFIALVRHLGRGVLDGIQLVEHGAEFREDV